MKITWLTNWDEIQDSTFCHLWQTMLDHWETPHVFFTRELCQAWLETYRPIRALSPRFLLLEDGDAKLLWPLVIWRQNWRNAFRRTMIAVGHSDFDYAEPIVLGDRNHLLNQAFAAIQTRQKEWDTVAINGLTGECGIGTPETDFCPFCRLEAFQSGEDFLQKSKKSLREDIRRQRNRCMAKGQLSFATATPVEAQQELPNFLHEHRAHWPNAYKAPNFHANLLKFGLPSTIVRFDMLKIDSLTIAWHLGFHYRKRFYYYMPAANQQWLAYSPNKLLLFELVSRAIAENDQIFDHLRGAENYKRGWTSEILNLWHVAERNRQNFTAIMRNSLHDCRLAIEKWCHPMGGVIPDRFFCTFSLPPFRLMEVA